LSWPPIIAYTLSTTLIEVYPCFFLSCKANGRVKRAKTRHGQHSFWLMCCSMYFLCCSMYFCFVLCIVCFVTFPVLFVCICVLNNCHRVATQLQLVTISVSNRCDMFYIFISYIFCSLSFPYRASSISHNKCFQQM
jgi:hypothetical protein